MKISKYEIKLIDYKTENRSSKKKLLTIFRKFDTFLYTFVMDSFYNNNYCFCPVNILILIRCISNKMRLYIKILI